MEFPKKIIIYTPNYDVNSGGRVVLHYLCHLANLIGFEAYLLKSRENIIFDFKKPVKSTLRIIKGLTNYLIPLKTNKNFNTPVLTKIPRNLDDYVVVYYEQVIGNPLNARNVLRYMLHFPGYHTGFAYFGFNEYHVLWEEVTNVMDFPHCKRQKYPMKVTYMLDHIYNKNRALNFSDRKIDCYMVRKGSGKEFIHPESAIKLDDLSHEKIARIFKISRYFYCYDEYTMYSRFAAMCGCIPIIIPDSKTKNKNDWNISKFMTHGIAYGENEIYKAIQENSTLDLIIEEEKNMQLKSIENTFRDALIFFEEKRYEVFRK